MRMTRMAAFGASLALLLAACGTGGGSSPTTGGNQTAPATTAGQSSAPATSGTGDTVASQLVFGGPPECPQRPFCLIGLQETYGLQFKEFKPLDVGGPTTVAALENGEIDVALLFTSNPLIEDNGWVELEDDKELQRADNLTPVVNAELLEANPNIADILNPVSAMITQEELLEMNRRATAASPEDADAIATDWLTENGFLENPQSGNAGPVVVGKTNFYEQDILAEIYGQTLEANGFAVEYQEASGNREVVFPTLESGDVDLLVEYLATALEYVNGGAGQATPDAEETAELFREAAAERGLTVLDPAPANDQNTLVVLPDTADEYGLATISDLAKPAP